MIRPSRWLVTGDPQTTTARFFEVLDRHGALGPDGLLREGVGLVSMGDHFDFLMGHPESEAAGREILAWLAAQEHAALVLLGNHDVARVAELAFETDASFAEARALAQRIWDAHEAGRLTEASSLVKVFHEAFPRIPGPGMVLRDFASFSVAQRELVERVLLSGRMQIAATATRGRDAMLLTHAGVTHREVLLLASETVAPSALAMRLTEHLTAALAAVRDSWQRDERRSLSLEPVHVAGFAGTEGGGLLYHRPARSDREGADLEWESCVTSPRRFDPRNLPRGLVQVVGHSGHGRCIKSLGDWVTEAAKAPHVPLRTLHVGDWGVAYEPGVLVPVPGEATVWMVDAGFADAPLETITLLEVDDVQLPRASSA